VEIGNIEDLNGIAKTAIENCYFMHFQNSLIIQKKTRKIFPNKRACQE
jgi:hypothetical protein